MRSAAGMEKYANAPSTLPLHRQALSATNSILRVKPLILAIVTFLALVAVTHILPNLNIQTPGRLIDTPSLESSSRSRRVAIIGSGITGSVAAYTLFESSRLFPDGPPSITIFERNPIVGGRITTADVYDDPRQRIDTCAATFAQRTDTCVLRAASSVGLAATAPQRQLAAGIGQWAGPADGFVGLIEDRGFRDIQLWTPFRAARWFERYGDAPQRFQQSVTNVQTFFTTAFSGVTGQNFTNLTEEVYRSSLNPSILDGILENRILNASNPKDILFLREVVEPAQRERFFADILDLNSLATVFGMGTDSVVEIQGGNLRLIDRLIKLSGASLSLSTKVQEIRPSKADRGGWELGGVRSNQPGKASSKFTDRFDEVIIATPIKLADLKIDMKLPYHGHGIPAVKDYEDVFVTHFTTSNVLNEKYFNTTKPAPLNVLTTPSAPFFSLTQVKALQNPKTRRAERLYKLVSSFAPTDEQLGKHINTDDDDPTTPAITWVYRESLPRSVPKQARKQTLLEKLELARGLWYAGGGEQVLPTVEVGCRFGSNVARLVSGRVQDWQKC